MTITAYTPDEIAAARAEYPGHFIVAVVTPHAACLIAIADTPANRAKTTPSMPWHSAEELDGNTLTSTGLASAGAPTEATT